jgi:hypothetical protein
MATQYLCPTCAKHRWGQVPGVIYSVCPAHVNTSPATVKPQPRIPPPPVPPDVQHYFNLWDSWNKAFEELQQAQRNLAYWRKHDHWTGRGDCYGCDEEEDAEREVKGCEKKTKQRGEAAKQAYIRNALQPPLNRYLSPSALNELKRKQTITVEDLEDL